MRARSPATAGLHLAGALSRCRGCLRVDHRRHAGHGATAAGAGAAGAGRRGRGCGCAAPAAPRPAPPPRPAPRRRPRRRCPRTIVTPCSDRLIVSVDVAGLSACACRRADRRHGGCDDAVDADAPSSARRAPRVAAHAVARAGVRGARPRRAHQRRVDRQRQRGVGQAGVAADLAAREAARLQRVRRSPRSTRGSTRGQRPARRAPLAVSAPRAPGCAVAAVVAEQHDVAQAVLAQAARRCLPAPPRRPASGIEIVPGQRMCCVGGSIAPSGT